MCRGARSQHAAATHWEAGSSAGQKRKARRTLDVAPEGPSAARGAGKLQISSKEDVFEWLKGNPAALKELLWKNVTIVVDLPYSRQKEREYRVRDRRVGIL